MGTSSGDDLTALISDLVTTLRELETEVEPTTDDGVLRPPTPSELLRFTSDVTIPAAILILRTNIEVLKLLRRALRLAEGRPTSTGAGTQEVRQRATTLSRQTLSRLDGALTEIQRAVEGTPDDEDTREILREARQLRAELETQLQSQSSDTDDGESTPDSENTDVPVDVDAELQSIKDDVDDAAADSSDPETPDDESS